MTTRQLGTKALLPILLLGGTAGAIGCGESTSKPAAAVATAATAAESSTAPATTSALVAANPTKGASPAPRAKSVRRRTKRVHIVLPPPGSHPEKKITSTEAAHLPTTDILLSSAGIKRRGQTSQYEISAEYTCNGSDRSLPIRWKGVPANTRELALFMLSAEPVEGKLYYDWAVAGIDPKLKGLEAGKLPPGAVLGRNSAGHAGYTVCPTSGKHENYVILLYALPKALAPSPNFDPAALRDQAKEITRHTGLLGGTYG